MRRRTSPLLALALGLLFAGCCCRPCGCCCPAPCDAIPTATVEAVPSAAAPPSGGLLGDTSAFRENPDRPGTWVWTRPGADLRAYDDLLVEEVRVQPRAGSTLAAMSAEEQAAAARALREALLQAVAPYYDVVESPGAHTLRLRVALVDVPTKDGGSSSVEAEMLDGKSLERLVAALGSLSEAERAAGGKTAGLSPSDRAARAWGARLLRYLDLHVK